MKIGFIFESLLENNIKFIDNSRDYSDGQHYKDIRLYVDGEEVAYADYSEFEDKVYIDNIEAKIKGKGYGQMIMKHLADIYGYENLERSSLTPDGVKMRQKLDKHFNFDYEKHLESKNKHLKVETIENIKNPLIKNFIFYMSKYGYQETWGKFKNLPEFLEMNKTLEEYDLDWNDVSDIAEWVKGSKTNDNSPDEGVPHPVLSDLAKLYKIK